MPATYEPIYSITLNSTVSQIVISSIPQTYTDLVLTVTGKGTGADDLYIRCNSDSTSNYSYTYLTSNGSSASSGRLSTSSGLLTDYFGVPSTNNNHIVTVHFNNYSNTTTNKTSISHANRADGGVDLIAALWRSTSAITSLTLLLPSWSLTSGTIANLYGIKAA